MWKFAKNRCGKLNPVAVLSVFVCIMFVFHFHSWLPSALKDMSSLLWSCVVLLYASLLHFFPNWCLELDCISSWPLPFHLLCIYNTALLNPFTYITYTFYSQFNTGLDLDPRNSVIKTFWCTSDIFIIISGTEECSITNGWCIINMSHCMTKPTKWHVRQAKTQIRPVWSVLAVHLMGC